MRRVLITGGTGFFGKSILDYRLRHPELMSNAEIVILSRNPRNFSREFPKLANQRGISFIAGDVRDFTVTGRFDTVIHAATAAVTTLSDYEMYSTIVDGARHVLEVAKGCGTQRLLFTSSGAVYGPKTEAVDETVATNPITAYGRGKLAAEKMCVDSGLQTKIARCYAFVGPYLNRRIHFAIGNFIQNCLDNEPIVIKGDGTPLRSYLYADDLVEWLFAILERGETGRPYNVGSPEGLSIREVAETVRTVLGTNNEIQILGTPTNKRTSVYIPKVNRAISELELNIKTTLCDAIQRSAAAV